MSLHRRVCLFVVSYLPLASCIGSFCDATYAYAESNGEISATHSPKAVLFVGNSFTFSRGGIDNQVEKLAESAKPAIAVKADKIWKGGATLKVLYEMPRVLEKIETGEYDVVVVQGDIPEAKERTVKSFENHAKLFAAKIKRKGNTPVLFMAWPYKRLGWVSLNEISNSHRELSNELGIKVAPVGLAFQMATKERPDLRMLGKDEEHQSIHGAFLAASVLYATVFTKNPAECTYHPRMVTPDEAAFLKRVAWNTVQEWNRGNQTKNSTEAAEVVIDPAGSVLSKPEVPSPVDIVNQRMRAYNSHDLGAFLKTYSDDIEIFNYPDKSLGKGKKHIRKIFEPMLKEGKVQVKIRHQIAKDSYVINHEMVGYGDRKTEYVSIYEVRKGLIKSVRFVRD